MGNAGYQLTGPAPARLRRAGDQSPATARGHASTATPAVSSLPFRRKRALVWI